MKHVLRNAFDEPVEKVENPGDPYWVPPEERLDVDGGEGSYALEGGNDQDAVNAARLT